MIILRQLQLKFCHFFRAVAVYLEKSCNLATEIVKTSERFERETRPAQTERRPNPYTYFNKQGGHHGNNERRCYESF